MGLKRVVDSFLTKPTNLSKNITYRWDIKPSSEKIIFVIGAPRSGTTLIQSVLGAHTKITGFSEETGFFMLSDFCKMSFDGVTNSEYKRIISSSSDLVEVFTKIAKLQVLKDETANYFLEKTPQHVLQLKRLLKWFPNAKFINIYRDVRDSSISAMKFSGIEQGRKIENFLRYWNKCVEARIAFESEKIIDVYYEDFVTNPVIELKKIMEFIGIEFEPHQLDTISYSKNKRAGSLGFENLNKSINSSSVGRWKNKLTKNQIELIEKRSGALLKKIGYL
ncbi:MAG: sulfotransferase [Pseudomonadota bacterium]|nr:sulfotransferase [Pseudomonadota bacterium]